MTSEHTIKKMEVKEIFRKKWEVKKNERTVIDNLCFLKGDLIHQSLSWPPPCTSTYFLSLLWQHIPPSRGPNIPKLGQRCLQFVGFYIKS